MDKIYNIAVVGAGQLGSRHLQSLKQVKFAANLFVIDSNEISLQLSKERYAEVAENEEVKSVTFSNTINDLPQEVDLVVLATGSRNRAVIIEEICAVANVRNFILEKILFQTIEEYGRISNFFSERKINAWVNCPRRMFPVYQLVKEKLAAANDPVVGLVDGSDWGLGCNAIHYIDAFAFVTGCTEYTIHTHKLDREIVQSKREGYVEFHGSINLHFSNGSTMVITSRKEAVATSPFVITTDGVSILLDEVNKKLEITTAENPGFPALSDFDFFYQSQLTSIAAEQILIDQKSDLTTYQESMQLHLPFIKALIEFLQEHYDPNINHCPIT